MASSCASPQLNPSKRCLIAPACPVCIMPLFFWWVEGVNCVVRGSLTSLRPPATLCISPNRTTVAWQPFCAQVPPHFKGLAEESVPWLLSPFVSARCLAHWSSADGWKVNIVMGKVTCECCKDLFRTQLCVFFSAAYIEFYLETQSYRNTEFTLLFCATFMSEKYIYPSKHLPPCLWFCQ